MFSTNQWLKSNKPNPNTGVRKSRVTLKNGATISIQASANHHCEPQEDNADYTSVEVKVLTHKDSVLELNYNDSVCSEFPVGSLDEIVNRYGVRDI